MLSQSESKHSMISRSSENFEPEKRHSINSKDLYEPKRKMYYEKDLNASNQVNLSHDTDKTASFRARETI